MTHRERLILFFSAEPAPGVFVFVLLFAVGGRRSVDDETVAKGPLGLWLGTRSHRERLEKERNAAARSPIFTGSDTALKDICIKWKSAHFKLLDLYFKAKFNFFIQSFSSTLNCPGAERHTPALPAHLPLTVNLICSADETIIVLSGRHIQDLTFTLLPHLLLWTVFFKYKKSLQCLASVNVKSLTWYYPALVESGT